MKFEWEEIKKLPLREAYRTKVFGGWLVETITTFQDHRGVPSSQASNMVFVPDLNHDWVVDNG